MSHAAWDPPSGWTKGEKNGWGDESATQPPGWDNNTLGQEHGIGSNTWDTPRGWSQGQADWKATDNPVPPGFDDGMPEWKTETSPSPPGFGKKQ